MRSPGGRPLLEPCANVQYTRLNPTFSMVLPELSSVACYLIGVMRLLSRLGQDLSRLLAVINRHVQLPRRTNMIVSDWTSLAPAPTLRLTTSGSSLDTLSFSGLWFSNPPLLLWNTSKRTTHTRFPVTMSSLISLSFHLARRLVVLQLEYRWFVRSFLPTCVAVSFPFLYVIANESLLILESTASA